MSNEHVSTSSTDGFHLRMALTFFGMYVSFGALTGFHEDDRMTKIENFLHFYYKCMAANTSKRKLRRISIE